MMFDFDWQMVVEVFETHLPDMTEEMRQSIPYTVCYSLSERDDQVQAELQKRREHVERWWLQYRDIGPGWLHDQLWVQETGQPAKPILAFATFDEMGVLLDAAVEYADVGEI